MEQWTMPVLMEDTKAYRLRRNEKKVRCEDWQVLGCKSVEWKTCSKSLQVENRVFPLSTGDNGVVDLIYIGEKRCTWYLGATLLDAVTCQSALLRLGDFRCQQSAF